MDQMEKIVSLAKRRGFVFPSSEIYGGVSGIWDYGPLGTKMKQNIKRLWWHDNVDTREDVVGLDSAILLHPKVWEASGHVASFSDPFCSCKFCNRQYRADKIWDLIWQSKWWKSFYEAIKDEKTTEDFIKWAKNEGRKLAPNLAFVLRPEVTLSWIANLKTQFNGISLDFKNFIGKMSVSADGKAKIPCPACGGELSEPVSANLMLPTSLGPSKATATKTYLRPETCQGIFINFENIITTSRLKLPFGIAQVGKVFRNEITPGNFTFRSREFEQTEMEFFVKPETAVSWLKKWVDMRYQWYIKYGIRKRNLRIRQQAKDELAHYAKEGYDIEYQFSWGWEELEGIVNRGDFDLKGHSKMSGKNLDYFDEKTKKRYFPFVIEPSGGVDRAMLAFLTEAFCEETVAGEKRTSLQLHKQIAPIQIAILPLAKNKSEIVNLTRTVFENLRNDFICKYDDSGSIGRLYRRQDEIGTPYCVTIDFESLKDKSVTIRERDSMGQERIRIEDLRKRFVERFAE